MSLLRRHTFVKRDKGMQKRPLKPIVSKLPLHAGLLTKCDSVTTRNRQVKDRLNVVLPHQLTRSAAHAVLCFGTVVLPISACLGAAVEALYVLPTELCGSEYEATCQSVYLSAGIERYDTKGFAERKSLETLVSKPTFGFFCLVTKETAAARSGAFVPARGGPAEQIY